MARWERLVDIRYRVGSPEVRLWAAVLIDVSRLMKQPVAVDHADAVAWVAARGEGSVGAFGTFEDVCGVLDLDVEVVRADLLGCAAEARGKAMINGLNVTYEMWNQL